MNSNTYITEIENLEPRNIPILSFSDNYENENTNFFPQDIKRNKSTPSSYLIKNESKFQQATSSVLEYMVNEETHFTDLEKIQDYFVTKSMQDFAKFNANKLEIEKKRQILENLNLKIEQEIVSVVTFNKDHIDEMYSSQINKAKQQIENQSHDLHVYEATYDKLYKENYQSKKILNENLKLAEVNDKQHDKYLIIKQNALRSFMLQKNLLHDMKEYNNVSTKQYDKDVEIKKRNYSKLEYDVVATKRNTEETQKNLEEIKLTMSSVEKLMEAQVSKNVKLEGDYKCYLKDFVMIKMRLMLIYRSLGVDDLDSIIENFKDFRIQYQGYSTLFYNGNKEISELSIIYTSYKEKLSAIKSNIKEIELNTSESSIQEMDMKARFAKERNKILIETTYEKDKLVKDTLKFFIKYDKKITDMVNSVYINTLKLENFSTKKREELIFKGKDKNVNLNQIEILNRIKEWTITECKNILFI